MTSSTLECLYCSRQVAATSAKSYTCRNCWRRNAKQFGAEWYLLDWHVALLPEARGMKQNPHGVVGMTDAERTHISFVGLDRVAEQVATDHDVVPTDFNGSKTNHSCNEQVRQAVLELYVTQRLGARRIFRKLKERDLPQVSFSSVQRYLAAIKRKLAAQDEASLRKDE